jgi:hypothetical protein
VRCRFKQFHHKHANHFKLPFASIAAAIDGQCAAALPFADGGILFHSLPLPIKTGLPVHINAAVNISSSRLHPLLISSPLLIFI